MEAAEFGKRIMKLRKQKGMTQSKLAEQINVSNKAMSRWETGEGFPEITLLKPLAKALGTTVDELFGEEEEKEEKQENETPGQCVFGFAGKKAAVEENPIDVAALKRAVTDFLKSGKWFFILYILVMTEIFFHAYTYHGTRVTDVPIARDIAYVNWLILGLSAIVIFGLQIWIWKKGYLDKLSLFGNEVAIVSFATGYFLCYKDRMKLGFWKCEYFTVNRVLMMRVTKTVLTFVFLIYIISLVKKWRQKGGKFKDFWKSLHLFNKISSVCFGISLLLLCWNVLRVVVVDYCADGYFTGLSLTATDMMSEIVIWACYMGVFSALLGLLLGIFGVYKRQTKGSVFLAMLCFAGRFATFWVFGLVVNIWNFFFDVGIPHFFV